MKGKKDIIVLKFGGTSVGDIDKIKKVAGIVISARNEGKSVVAVLSAMGNTTDRLIDLAGEITSNPSRREMDMLMSTGEQVSSALLAMAIQEKGYKCSSLTGGQAGILTDEFYSNAKILNIKTERILKELKRDRIVVVAGFQGVNINDDITTLGRGGSDTTAVALASALKAKYCEIYTDVEGVYSTDPNVVGEAAKLEALSYDEMLELASSGAKVIHLRAVEFAKKHGVILHIRSSFNNIEGTWVMDDFKEDMRMERPAITGVTYDVGEVKVSIFGLEDKPGVAADLFGILAEKNINIEMISTSPIRVSCVVKKSRIKEAVKALHSGFELEK